MHPAAWIGHTIYTSTQAPATGRGFFYWVTNHGARSIHFAGCWLRFFESKRWPKGCNYW